MTKKSIMGAKKPRSQKLKRVALLLGKHPGELDGNKRRTLRMALKEGLVKISQWTGVILKEGGW